MMLGLRGFPGVQGGVETHAEELCPRLVALGCEVEVIVRSSYQAAEHGQQWQGVRFKRLWTPKHKSLEAIVHTFLGVCYAALKRPDVLHIQAIGPALMVPLARILGLKVVVTHHGPDYERQKWGGFAKKMLEMGEKMGMCYSHARIVISEVIHNLVQKKYGVDAYLIPNGVTLPPLLSSTAQISKFGLKPAQYVLLVSRLVPEKRHVDLIQAFIQANLAEWKLVLVGGSDHPDDYVVQLRRLAESTSNVVMTGYKSGVDLQELYGHAAFFVLPSSHEGLPIAMLEALSYGLPVLASNISANLEVGLPAEHYFALGDIQALADKLVLFAGRYLEPTARETLRTWVSEHYNWDDIAQRTLSAYKSVKS